MIFFCIFIIISPSVYSPRNYTYVVGICEITVMGYLFDANDGLFVTNTNTLLQLPPIFITTMRSSIECAAECLQPRQDQICMGFNWISSTKQCQLMDFSTRNTSLSSLLVYNTDATFTALEQAWNKWTLLFSFETCDKQRSFEKLFNNGIFYGYCLKRFQNSVHP
jgi:hypothetical protein